MASDIGRVLIATEGALRNTGFRDDQEREDFCSHLADRMDKDTKQTLLTWRHNRVLSKG